MKRFIVRKYVMAKDAIDAIKNEKRIPVDDVWIDENWKQEATRPVGFAKDERDA